MAELHMGVFLVVTRATITNPTLTYITHRGFKPPQLKNLRQFKDFIIFKLDFVIFKRYK